MTQEIIAIMLPMPLNSGAVNCYLVKTDAGYFLVDSGYSNQRTRLERVLLKNGVKPGNLRLILITHGDFDHTGNAAYLRQKYGARIAMHLDDVGMAEKGDMFWNRKQPNTLVRALLGLAFGLKEAERFTPDVLVEDGQDLVEYGWAATVYNIPGHSKGSIGILTRGGELFCGDLLNNTKTPAINSIMDDLPSARKSVEKLRALGVRTVYAGHGRQFEMEALQV